MKWFLMVMMFSSVGMADKLIVEISSDTNEEVNKTHAFERPPETTSVFNRKKQFFDLGANDVSCDVSFFQNIAAIECGQTKDKKDRVIAEHGFSVSTIVDCSKGNEGKLSFSNKIKKSGKWALFSVRIKCEQDKI